MSAYSVHTSVTSKPFPILFSTTFPFLSFTGIPCLFTALIPFPAQAISYIILFNDPAWIRFHLMRIT